MTTFKCYFENCYRHTFTGFLLDFLLDFWLRQELKKRECVYVRPCHYVQNGSGRVSEAFLRFQKNKEASKQASKQASRQAHKRHSVGAMPCRGLLYLGFEGSNNYQKFSLMNTYVNKKAKCTIK